MSHGYKGIIVAGGLGTRLYPMTQEEVAYRKGSITASVPSSLDIISGADHEE